MSWSFHLKIDIGKNERFILWGGKFYGPNAKNGQMMAIGSRNLLTSNIGLGVCQFCSTAVIWF